MEKDTELQQLYKQFFDVMSPEISYSIINDISKNELANQNNFKDNKAGYRLFNYKSSDKSPNLDMTCKSYFDVIIIDINFRSHKGIEIAKKILEKFPLQKIIFTTTLDYNTISKDLSNIECLHSITILRKPFKFSELLTIVSPAKTMFEKLKLTDHILGSYNTEKEELLQAVDFMKMGIKLNEMNLLLIRKDMDVKKTILFLKSNGLDLIDFLLQNKSLLILENEEWYMPDGKVDKQRIIKQWENLVDQCKHASKNGLRAFCRMDCFFENGFSKALVDYERSLPSHFQIPFVPICAYRQSD